MHFIVSCLAQGDVGFRGLPGLPGPPGEGVQGPPVRKTETQLFIIKKIKCDLLIFDLIHLFKG